jgi:hypothetical protein
MCATVAFDCGDKLKNEDKHKRNGDWSDWEVLHQPGHTEELKPWTIPGERIQRNQTNQTHV